MRPSKTRAVVVGSGMSGLTAAAVLSAMSHEVVVLEKAPVAAPLLRGFARRGAACDLGLHYTGGFGANGMFTRLLDRLEVLDDIEAVAMNRDGFDRIIWQGHDLDLRIPVGLEAVRDRLASAFPASAEAVSAYLEVIREGLEQTPFLNPDVPASHLEASRYEKITVADFLRREGAAEDLVRFLGDYGAFLFGCDGEEAPLRTHSLVLGSYFASAHTVRGGGQAIADAFIRRLQGSGVQVLTDRAARGIEVDSEGGVSGVRVEGDDVIAADLVVFTAHPELLPALLPEASLRAAYHRRLGRMRNTPGMFIGYLDSVHSGSCGDHNTYVILDDAVAETAGHRYLGLMAGSPPAQGMRSSTCMIRDVAETDFGAAAGGGFDERPDDYEQRKITLLEQTVETARAIVGAEAVGGEILETVTPYSFERWTGTPSGSVYGLKRPLKGRRLHPLTPVANLLLAGQSMLYPGIMGAAASALVACGLAVGHDALWRRVMR